MAPIKFEEQLKDKLEKRTLSPSAEGWAKLSDRLDAEDKKSQKPIYWWLSIAALLVVMVAITIQVFNKEEGTTVAPQIVNEEPNEINNDKEDAVLIDNNDLELVIEEDTLKDQEIEEEAFQKPVRSNVKQLVKSSSKPKTQLATNTEKGETKNLKTDEELAVNNNAIVNQPEIDITVVAEALENNSTDNAVQLDKEVDSLLKLASKELTKNNLLRETSKTVDANALLDEVQDEMGQSFRSKVYEMLKDSYKTVKTAVAQRNN